jgi:uncharacterized protein
LIVRAAIASMLVAQTLILPLTGARTRDIRSDTLFHTLFHDFFPETDGTTYVQTGDIPAMWLRDSSAQTIPYVRFTVEYASLRTIFAGVIERDARAIDLDPYANAFQADYHTWERKWEVDSIAWPVLLAKVYVDGTGDRSIFTPQLHAALQRIVATYACEERHRECSHYVYRYHVPTKLEFDEGTGLIWCAFRPSDDPVEYRFNIPQNILAVVALRDIAQLAADGYGDARLSRNAQALAARVMTGILRYGIFFNASRRAWMYTYETDGFGNNNLMDDANVPNLTTLPALDWLSAYDPTYLNTRAFTLSMDNPWYFSGRYAQGLGSPHTPYGYVWPLGIIGRALTSTDVREIEASITTLAETDSEDGLIHESFYPDGYWRYTRQEFGWANAFYAELLFRTLAGFPLQRHTPGNTTIVPLEVRWQTPALVSPLDQLNNTADLVRALGQQLDGADAPIDQAP